MDRKFFIGSRVLMTGKIVTTKSDKQTLAIWLSYWLEIYAKPNVTSSTYRGYESVIRNHVISEIGSIRLCDLRKSGFQQFFNKKSQVGRLGSNGIVLSQKSLKNIYNVIHIALQSAVESGVIQYNPVEKIKMPVCKEREERFLTLDEQEILKSHINKYGSISSFGIILILETGIRKHELLSLKWSDIDFDNRTVMLYNRIIPMTNDFFTLLVLYKEKQQEEMEQKSHFQNEDTYIIMNRKFERYTLNGYNRVIRSIAKGCGITFLSATILRNTFGANCLKFGLDIATLSYIMGDSNVYITKRRYGKLISDIVVEL